MDPSIKTLIVIVFRILCRFPLWLPFMLMLLQVLIHLVPTARKRASSTKGMALDCVDSIHCRIALQGKSSWQNEPALMDSGAEFNVIGQSCLARLGLRRIEGAILPYVWVGDGRRVTCHGAYRVRIRVKDDWGQERE